MNFYIPSKYLSKLNHTVVFDNKFLIPQYTNLFLEYCYGSDWQIPKKDVQQKQTCFKFCIFYITKKSYKNYWTNN